MGQKNYLTRDYNKTYTTRKVIKRAIRIYVHFIFIFNSYFNNNNCAMVSKYYYIELRANLFNGEQVEENFCPHSVIIITTTIIAITISITKTTKKQQ